MTTESTNRIVEPLKVRVARGATMLDSKNPNWFNEIDLRHLDMGRGERRDSSDDGCVLCQLSAEYCEEGESEEWQAWDRGQKQYSLNNDSAVDHGFVCERFHTSYRGMDATKRWMGVNQEYAEMNRLWRDEILKRREVNV